jgi:lipopolysaccharide export system ATP-binding protein
MSLIIKELSKEFAKRKVVHRVSFELKQSQIMGLLGPNGAGKTTLFYMIAGLINSDEGDILLNQISLTNLGISQRSEHGISYLPQESSIFRKLSVEENILSSLEQRQDLTKDQISEELDSLLNEFGLNELRKSKSIQLSGGERRRVEIARALAKKPNFLLLDEPFAGIDPIAVSELKDIFRNLKKKKIGILISDHNVVETMKICDQVLIMNKGKEIAVGKPSDVSKDQLVKDVYLGKDFLD